jgi:hypothetical protein
MAGLVISACAALLGVDDVSYSSPDAGFPSLSVNPAKVDAASSI